MTWSYGGRGRAAALAALAAGALALSSLGACERTAPAAERAGARKPTADSMRRFAATLSTAGVDPGIHPQVVYGVRHDPYTGDITAATEGRQLFVQYNCSGCHGGRAGGGMGPSLRDSLWIYGSSDTQLLSTILEGRSAGMPAWGGRLPEDQIWKIVAYIRTLGTPQEPDPPPAPAQPLASAK
ncbi:MAG TPA: c-type cytochrome [Gemmatimonadaceae bacterium]|nr:c-type cytochrome [Gemmatimonadaceae bacterium]